MSLQIVPTTTYDDLVRNNTSAADSFPGWPNGLPKPGNVSHVPLNIPQQAFAHLCPWWDTGPGRSNSHPDIGIKSNDPAYCARTANDMKLRGFNGCFFDWYGPTSYEDRSTLAMKPELEKLGMKFALCVDGGMKTLKAAVTDASRTIALLNAITYARNVYFTSPSYLRVGVKPVVLFFGFATGDYDWTKVRSAMQDCILIFRWERNPQYSARPYADGYFGWTDNSEEWIQNLKSRAPGKLIVLGVNGSFNNTIEGEPVRCTWGVGKEKVIDPIGGMVLQGDLALCRAHPEITLTSFNTLNDYQEGSALEVGIASGQSFSISEGNGVLKWNAPNEVFDRVDLYVSKDGGKMLMPIAIARGVTEVDLKPMDFDEATYSFLVQAVGKPMVQNVVSNIVTATLGWGAGASA